MDWSDCEFVQPGGGEDEPRKTTELTGWETVIFELDDEEAEPE